MELTTDLMGHGAEGKAITGSDILSEICPGTLIRPQGWVQTEAHPLVVSPCLHSAAVIMIKLSSAVLLTFLAGTSARIFTVRHATLMRL